MIGLPDLGSLTVARARRATTRGWVAYHSWYVGAATLARTSVSSGERAQARRSCAPQGRVAGIEARRASTQLRRTEVSGRGLHQSLPPAKRPPVRNRCRRGSSSSQARPVRWRPGPGRSGSSAQRRIRGRCMGGLEGGAGEQGWLERARVELQGRGARVFPAEPDSDEDGHVREELRCPMNRAKPRWRPRRSPGSTPPGRTRRPDATDSTGWSSRGAPRPLLIGGVLTLAPVVRQQMVEMGHPPSRPRAGARPRSTTGMDSML